MVRTRKGIYIGNQEIQRRYIGNKLIFENLDDMDDKDKVSGTEIFTDKADNSVVHVEIDGKSYQDGEPTPNYPIEIHSVNDFDVVSSVEKLTEGQLEEYDYDTEYENIYKTNISLSEPLRSADDVRDRIFRDSDGLWKVERNVGEYTTGGTDTWRTGGSEGGWSTSGSTRAFFSSTLLNRMKPARTINSMTDKFTVGDSTNGIVSSDSEGFSLGYASWGVVFRIEKSRLTTDDVEGFTEWIANNPVTIVYELAGPTIETLDQELQDKLNNLRSFQDSNYVYTIINDILPTVAEDLKPTLHAAFKSKSWYDDYQNTLLK